jgi:hypothetical protein
MGVINRKEPDKTMPLTYEEMAEILVIQHQGHQASDLVPFLKKLISNNRLNDISEAINQFVRVADANRSQIRSYLIARIPGLLINFYWPERERPLDYDSLIRYTLENDDWANRIRNTVDFEGDLLAVAAEIENEAMRSEGRQN